MNNASGGDGIPVELFQTLKDDAVAALTMPAYLENSAVATGLENISFHSLEIASGPITSWEIDGETVETVSDFILGGSKITVDGDCSHEIKRHLLLGKKVMTNLDSI